MRGARGVAAAVVLLGVACAHRVPAPSGSTPHEKLDAVLWMRTSGEWAAYEFTRYREGTALLIQDPGIAVRRGADRLELEGAVPWNQETRIGLCAVIEDLDGNLSYWALRHAPGKPDFHHADSFALELDEVRH